MSRVPIRVRLAALLALAMMLVLAGAGLFVYLRLADDLDESVDSALEARAAAVAASGQVAAGSAGDPEDGFAQLLAADGRVLARTGGAGGAALTRAGARARRGRRGRRGRARGRGRRRRPRGCWPCARRRRGRRGRASRSRTATRRSAALAGAFALGAPVAALVVALLGYALAAAGLRPVERMRRRAAGVSLEARAEPLPLPGRARRDPPARRDAQRDARPAARAPTTRERRFVADASHELRTPVAVIKAELEAALRRAPADPDLREALTAAVEECDRLAQLAEDLLVLARSGDGALAVRPEPLDAAELLERVRTRFSARAAERGRELARRAPSRAWSLRRRRAAALAGARQPRRQRAAPRRGRDHAARAARRRARSSSRSPTRAPGFAAGAAPGARSSASPAATRRAPAAAPGSGWRSCARSRRPTAAPPSSADGARRAPAIAVSGRSKLAPIRCHPCQPKEEPT